MGQQNGPRPPPSFFDELVSLATSEIWWVATQFTRIAIPLAIGRVLYKLAGIELVEPGANALYWQGAIDEAVTRQTEVEHAARHQFPEAKSSLQ